MIEKKHIIVFKETMMHKIDLTVFDFNKPVQSHKSFFAKLKNKWQFKALQDAKKNIEKVQYQNRHEIKFDWAMQVSDCVFHYVMISFMFGILMGCISQSWIIGILGSIFILAVMKVHCAWLNEKFYYVHAYSKIKMIK